MASDIPGLMVTTMMLQLGNSVLRWIPGSFSWSTFLAATLAVIPGLQADELPSMLEESTISQLDGETQPLLYWAPEEAATQATPLFVFLHSWSSDYKQDNSKWFVECVRHRWIWLHPDFRGINQAPKACGSTFARQDVLDAVSFARKKWTVDSTRIYLAGVSGGGHMSLLMAGHHPDEFSAVSSWVGPTDLADWYRFHLKGGKPQKYATMISTSLGGPPGLTDDIDADYRDRSPVYHLHQVGDLPISIWAGVQDGHAGSVPIRHSLRAFNAIAKGHGSQLISEREIDELSLPGLLTSPAATDTEDDATLGRKLYLRRKSRDSIVTIFEGGHESIPEAAFAWLKTRQRKVAD